MKPDRRCATCAFRPGTEASQDAETMTFARLCIVARSQFDCHEHDRPCAGWLAAVQAARPVEPSTRKRADRLLDALTELRQPFWFMEILSKARKQRMARLRARIDQFFEGRSA